ncbi:MAG: hypothetical protein ACM34I_05205 [bacterium]
MFNTSGRQTTERPTGDRVMLASLFVFALFFTVLASGLPAEAVDCSGIADSGERLKCKHGNVLEEQDRIITNLELNFGQVVPTENFERLKKANNRAKNSKDRMNAKQFKSLGKKNAETCDLVEWEGDGDGICEPGEKCEEVIGDNIGDDVQPCKLKGNKKEVCVEICTGGSEDTLEDDTDPLYLADVEQSYDDVTNSLDAANDILESNGPQIASMAVSLLTASEPADACKASADWLAYADILTITIMKQVQVGLRGIADIAERGCDQTGAGFNCATCCIILEGAAAVSALVTETTDGIFNLIEWGVDNSKQSCMSSISADLQELKATLGTVASTTSGTSNQLSGAVADIQTIKTTVNNLTTSVDSLNADVDGLHLQIDDLRALTDNRFNEVYILLNTPQGQRPDFPLK